MQDAGPLDHSRNYLSTSHGRSQELDPHGKFSSLSDVWAWRATRNGSSAAFASCCTPDGFSGACACASRLDCS